MKKTYIHLLFPFHGVDFQDAHFFDSFFESFLSALPSFFFYCFFLDDIILDWKDFFEWLEPFFPAADCFLLGFRRP